MANLKKNGQKGSLRVPLCLSLYFTPVEMEMLHRLKTAFEKKA
jgi:hypothetical protein